MKVYALSVLSLIACASAFTVQPSAFTNTYLKASYSLDAESGVGESGQGPSAQDNSSLAVTAETEPVDSSTLSSQDLWKSLDTIRIQGDTLRTCSFDECVERVEVLLKSGGRPINANVELWQGHHNDPQRIKVYIEDGDERTFRAILESPGSSNSVSIRNVSTQEYPVNAGIEADFGGADSAGSPAEVLKSMSTQRRVQGGAVYTLPFAPEVQAIQVMLNTDGRPMQARVELLQGPNNVKQSMEIYCEDGLLRPLYTVFDAPGSGNQIRIVNTATVEYPLECYLEPYIVDDSFAENSSGTNWS